MLGKSIKGGLLTDLKNTFTYEFWIEPGNVHYLDKQSSDIPSNKGGKNYIIGPAMGINRDHAVISVSAGMNGITVFESNLNNIYPVLVYETNIQSRVHISVVYDNKTPFLYVNSRFIKKGETSKRKYVYPSGVITGIPGLMFLGEISEIRIWDHRRSESQISAYMNSQLTGKETGLYGAWQSRTKLEGETNKNQVNSNRENHPVRDPKISVEAVSTLNRSNTSNKPETISSKNQATIDVSVIIPSYNKYPLNLFTLYSLEQQTFDPKKMEVIFIDDASTDQTAEMLNDYHPSYHFKFIRNQQNLGRAKVRNLGIQHSRGRILIFLDAEMITEANFVKNHYNFHQSKTNSILSGVMHSKMVISCIFPEFSTSKLKMISELTKNNQILRKRFSNYQHPGKTAYPLIDKSDITNKTYEALTIKTDSWFHVIPKNFGNELQGFEFPWMAFLTGNVSLPKELIVKAGLFDEDFVKYGYEDWELGYRLYKNGAKYFVQNDCLTYHQEHPVGEGKWKEAMENYYLFYAKHPDIDILILGIELTGLVDLLTMNDVLREYKLLIQSYPEKYRAFQERFKVLLETILLLLFIDIRHINIVGAMGIEDEQKKELLMDIHSIKKLRKFSNLTRTVEKALNS